MKLHFYYPAYKIHWYNAILKVRLSQVIMYAVSVTSLYNLNLVTISLVVRLRLFG